MKIISNTTRKQDVSRECVVIETGHTTTALHVKLTKCFNYRMSASWWTWYSCSETRTTTEEREGCVFSTPPDSICAEKLHDHNCWWLSHSNYVTNHCYCVTTEADAALREHSPYLYCSFDDCSTCSKSEMEKGQCNLPSGTSMVFDPTTFKKFPKTQNTSTLQAKIYSSPLRVDFDVFHQSFPLIECSDNKWCFKDDVFDIKCPRTLKRSRRDTGQQYVVDLLSPSLADIATIMTMSLHMWGHVLSQPLLDYTTLIRGYMNRSDITGTINGDVMLYWLCDEVTISMLPWNALTLYPPIRVEGMNGTKFINPYTSIIYSNSPKAQASLYITIRLLDNILLMGCTGSNSIPKILPQIYNKRLTVSGDYTIPDTLQDERTVTHMTDPTYYAVGPDIDLDAIRHEAGFRTDHGVYLQGLGVSSILYMNPWHIFSDMYIQMSHIGGCIFFIACLIKILRIIKTLYVYGRSSLPKPSSI